MRQAVSRHSAQLGHDTTDRRWAGARGRADCAAGLARDARGRRQQARGACRRQAAGAQRGRGRRVAWALGPRPGRAGWLRAVHLVHSACFPDGLTRYCS